MFERTRWTQRRCRKSLLIPAFCGESKGITRLQGKDEPLETRMARYKRIDTSPRFLAADLERHLLPGTFEHALNHLIDHELDLSGFDTRYNYDPVTVTCSCPAGKQL